MGERERIGGEGGDKERPIGRKTYTSRKKKFRDKL